MAVAKSVVALHKTLRTSRLFQNVKIMGNFDQEKRSQVLASMLKRRASAANLHVPKLDPEKLSQYAADLQGFSLEDLSTVVSSAIQNAGIAGSRDMIPFIGTTIQHAVRQRGAPEVVMPIGGLAQVQHANCDSPQGVMLIGPPGCGKSLIAEVVSAKCQLTLRRVKGPELLSKYIGGSETAVRRVFEEAQQVAPCVIFFDEIEALAPRRGGESTGVTDRVVNQMLCYLDGIEARREVFVMGATSRPDLVDPALMRPGRFDKILYCGIPNKNERADILQQLLESVEPWVQDLGRDVPARLTGADIRGLITTAQLDALKEGVERVEERHVRAALSQTRPSLSVKQIREFHRLYRGFLSPADIVAVDEIERELWQSKLGHTAEMSDSNQVPLEETEYVLHQENKISGQQQQQQQRIALA